MRLIGGFLSSETLLVWSWPSLWVSDEMEKRTRMSQWSLPERYRQRLAPATVIDVGVNRGTPELYAAFPAAHYLLVEPNRENLKDIKKILQTVNGEHEMAAAGSRSGTAVINVETSRTGLSSFLNRSDLTATGTRIERREVSVRTIDEMVASRKLEGPFGLKIDTEGFELEVLRGAPATLKDCQFVITETSTAKRFEGGYESVDLI